MPIPKKKNELATMQARLAEIADRVQEISDAADERLLTGDEQTELDALNTEFDELEAKVQKEIKARAGVVDLANRSSAAVPRKSKPEDLEEPSNIKVGDKVGASKRTCGFQNVGEFASAVRERQLSGQLDDRLKTIMNAPTTFGSEGVNQDGGFLVPPDFREAILVLLQNEENLSARCDQQTTQSNSMTYPVDSVSPWDTASGVRVNWTGEGNAITQTKPAFGQQECKAHKVSALVPLTEELIQDVPAVTGWLNTKVAQKLNSELNNVIVAGNGVAKPLGLLNAPCVVSQAAEGGQATATIVYNNIIKMWARMYAPLRYNAIWIANQDVDPQLQQLTVTGGSVAYPAWLPPGGLSQNKYATLMGRPIVYVEACSALGTVGDLILTDLSQYLLLMKGGGLKSDVSMHLYFDTGHIAYRFEMRVGGQSYWPSTITRKNSSNTLAPIVTLATRP